MREWEKDGCPGGYSYTKIQGCMLQAYLTSLEKHHQHITVMMPLFWSLGSSLFWTATLAHTQGKEADEDINDVAWALDTLLKVPGLIITEIEQSDSSEITKVWPLIPAQTRDAIVSQAKNHPARIEKREHVDALIVAMDNLNKRLMAQDAQKL